MPDYPRLGFLERRELALRIERFIARLEAMNRQPTRYEGERLMRALGLLSAGDTDLAKETVMEVERADRFVPFRRTVASPSPITMTQLRRRLEAVMHDVGL